MKQEIKKEVVLQMIWDRHFDLGMEKDLDDICEDIYNEVFVPLLEKSRKETAKEILQLFRKAYAHFEYKPNISKKAKWIAVEDLYKQADLLVCTLPNAILGEVAKQYGVEVE